jgi:ribosomal protein S18 acetylase RimI-like enzyme
VRIKVIPAHVVRDAQLLYDLWHEIFGDDDNFTGLEEWIGHKCFFVVVANQAVGLIVLQHNFKCTVSADTVRSYGSLFIAGTGIVSEFRGEGIGTFVKRWEINYARKNRFKRISTNCRKSNARIIGLNQKFGFRIIRTVPYCYSNPEESAVVMELSL